MIFFPSHLRTYCHKSVHDGWTLRGNIVVDDACQSQVFPFTALGLRHRPPKKSSSCLFEEKHSQTEAFTAVSAALLVTCHKVTAAGLLGPWCVCLKRHTDTMKILSAASLRRWACVSRLRAADKITDNFALVLHSWGVKKKKKTRLRCCGQRWMA